MCAVCGKRISVCCVVRGLMCAVCGKRINCAVCVVVIIAGEVIDSGQRSAI